MVVEENKAVVRRINEEVISGKDLALADELFSPEYMVYPSRPGRTPVPENAKRAFSILHEAFPDLRANIESMVAERRRGSDASNHERHAPGEVLRLRAYGQPSGVAVSRFLAPGGWQGYGRLARGGHRPARGAVGKHASVGQGGLIQPGGC